MNRAEEHKFKWKIIDWLKYWRAHLKHNKWKDYSIFIKEQRELITLFWKIFWRTEWQTDSYYYNDSETKFFWKISNENKKNIISFIKWRKLSPEIKKEVIKNWKNIFALLTSLNPNIPNKNINDYIIKELNNSWKALEIFILYSINEFWNNENITVEKWKYNFEPNKIDFITEYIKTSVNVNIAVQVTTSENLNKNYKEEDMKNLSYILDNPWKTFESRGEKHKKILDERKLDIINYRKEDIPDIPVLFIINSTIWKTVKEEKNSKNNSFKEAYKNIWKWELLKNLENKENKKELEIIWKTYPILIEKAIKDLNKIDLNENFQSDIIKEDYETKICYNSGDNIYKMDFYKKINNDKTFLYSLDFFITNKFLKKIWKQQEIPKRKYIHKNN